MFANAFSDALGTGLAWTVIFLAVVMYCVKKFGDANPEVKDAAKKAAAAKALQRIARLFK